MNPLDLTMLEDAKKSMAFLRLWEKNRDPLKPLTLNDLIWALRSCAEEKNFIATYLICEIARKIDAEQMKHGLSPTIAGIVKDWMSKKEFLTAARFLNALPRDNSLTSEITDDDIITLSRELLSEEEPAESYRILEKFDHRKLNVPPEHMTALLNGLLISSECGPGVIDLLLKMKKDGRLNARLPEIVTKVLRTFVEEENFHYAARLLQSLSKDKTPGMFIKPEDVSAAYESAIAIKDYQNARAIFRIVEKDSRLLASLPQDTKLYTVFNSEDGPNSLWRQFGGEVVSSNEDEDDPYNGRNVQILFGPSHEPRIFADFDNFNTWGLRASWTKQGNHRRKEFLPAIRNFFNDLAGSTTEPQNIRDQARAASMQFGI